jgi:hypothetical protein
VDRLCAYDASAHGDRLAGVTGLDACWEAASPCPPRRELRESRPRGSGARHAVVGADVRGPADVLEQAYEHPLGLLLHAGADSAWQPSRKRLKPSATVSGEQDSPSPVFNCPVKSAVHTALGTVMSVIGVSGWSMCRG